MASPVVSVLDGYPQAEGAKWGAVANVTGPTSYTTGGFTLSAVSFGMNQIEFASAGTGSAGVHSYIVRNPSTSDVPSATITVMAFLTSTGLQVSAATDLSASTFRIRVIGV
jgi:hypothetical protein